MTARSMLFASVALVMAATLRPASAEILQGVPDVIVCPLQEGALVVYVARRLSNGSTLYESLEHEFMTVIMIDTSGVLHWENRPGCDGKSVQQLRDEGKAFDFGS